MVNFTTALTTIATLAAVATAQGTASLNSITCGSTKYTRKQVDEATGEGCRLFAAGQQVGTNNYPHQFNNREALVFAASGPYQEFPIVSGGNYTGRELFLPRGRVAGFIRAIEGVESGQPTATDGDSIGGG